jgi:2-phosphosulfolactate phosphatase
VAVIPCGEVDEARRVAEGFPPGEALLAGERQGLPIDGFDLGNSPDSCTPETCRGKTLVMTTTNGTRAILASLDAERVVVGAFPNFAATAQLVHADRRPIHVVCSGTDRCISYEDSLLAGAFARHFKDMGGTLMNDEAEIVSGLWVKIDEAIWYRNSDRSRGERVAEANPLVRYIVRGRGGRRVTELGLARDIEAAARLNSHDHNRAFELRRDPLRIVPVR